MKQRTMAWLVVAWLCLPAVTAAQTSSMFSNLANPAIGMNAGTGGAAAEEFECVTVRS